MIAYMFLIFGTAIFWTLFGVGVKLEKKWLYGFSAIFGSFAAGALIGLTIALILKPDDDKAFCEDKAYWEDITKNVTPSMSLTTVTRTFKKAEEINEKILLNREKVGNNFDGIFYSQAIADLELIEIPTLYMKDFDPGIIKPITNE